MAQNLTQKIIGRHLVAGRVFPGEEIGIRIDQTLTQDATGTLAFLQFEALGLSRVRTKVSVSYVDHNTLQSGPENADDHLFLQGMAAKYGVYFSRPGNGICHQVHLERFAVPGETLLGSDSHTPTAGGMGMLAIGAGGLDVAVAMAGEPFYFVMPKVVLVRLMGKRQPWVSAKDIILELLRRLTVKGGVGRIFEYGGEGVGDLTVPERAAITNMGAELGATTSLFGSDQTTLTYLEAQGREGAFRPLQADPDAEYDEEIEINLSSLEPLIACPHSPDNVVPVREVAGTRVHQVAIGSCTNSSYQDLMTVARILRGKQVHPGVSLVVSPGSRQVLEAIARSGALADFIAAGARILESACGPCIGMGQAPPSGGVSVRTFNRNFEGRAGTPDARVYLASPEVAAATVIAGVIADPRSLGRAPRIPMPETFHVDDSMILPPSADGSRVEIVRGPNIKPLPLRGPVSEPLRGVILLKVADNITTDHILPAGAHVLPLRSNIPAIAEYTFTRIDPGFPRRARERGGGFIVGGSNYGQGSSREHAALAPMYLGVQAVLARSFARIHRANLVNFGILPMLIGEEEYHRLKPGDELEVPGVLAALHARQSLQARNTTGHWEFDLVLDLTPREREILVQGGLLNAIRAWMGAKGNDGCGWVGEDRSTKR
ncbi:MAG: aconitate hydratase [Candidatus Methylomirabilales bacterium]